MIRSPRPGSDMNMDRTKAAWIAYEKTYEEGWKALLSHPDPTNEQVLALEAMLDGMARNVGHAFGLDTQNFNDMETCEMCVRPGPWLRRILPKLEARVD